MSQQTPRYDVLMVTDARFPGGSSASVAEEIVAQTRAGYRTGLLHLPSTVLQRPRPFNPKLRRLLERGDVELVVGVDRVETRLLLGRHPSVFTAPPRELPKVIADEFVLAVNQVPIDDRGNAPYYDIPTVAANMERMFGLPARWGPIGPRVRDSLVDAHGVVEVMDQDWENIIDVARWQVQRTGFVGDRPVLGRHSRGHWTKWPEQPEDILAAYPDDPGYEVSILGGVQAPRRILGRVPGNWVDHPFDSIPATEFLSNIDFFVYFHHPGLIEAFGRVVLEGMAAGAVCIVPPYLQRLFDDVCLYGTPHDVRGYVDELYGDWEGFRDRSERGVALARERFSYETHVGRIASLIGDPSADEPHRVAAGSAFKGSRRPVTLVADLTGPGVHDAPVAAVVGAVEGPVLSLVPAAAASDDPGVHQELLPRAVEQLPSDVRRGYVRQRFEELLALHEPPTVIAVTDTDVGDLDVPFQVTVRRGGPTSAELGGLAAQLAAVAPAGWGVHVPEPDPEPDAVPAEPAAPAERSTRPSPPKWLYWRGKRQLRRGKAKLRRLKARGMDVVQRAKPRLAPAVHWARARRDHTLDRVAGRAGLVVVDQERRVRPVLPLPGNLTHPDPARLPASLVVVTVGGERGRQLVHALAGRQQVTSAFRLGLVVPPDCEATAHVHGLTAETLLPEAAYHELHGEGWSEYLRGRVRAAQRAFAAHNVLLADDPEDPAILDVLEATGAPPPAR